MSTYSAYYLASPPTAVELELLEISHHRFSKTYRIVSNSTEDVIVTHEGGAGPFTYSGSIPLQIRRLGTQNDLDQALRIDLGDLGSVLPLEIDAVLTANEMLTKPVLKYRTYDHRNLTVPLSGPSIHEITSVNFNKTGASFEAASPKLNVTRTGKLYEVPKFPMMVAFFKKG